MKFLELFKNVFILLGSKSNRWKVITSSTDWTKCMCHCFNLWLWLSVCVCLSSVVLHHVQRSSRRCRLLTMSLEFSFSQYRVAVTFGGVEGSPHAG